MRIAFGWSTIDVRCWGSKDALLGFMSRFGERLLMGESAEQETEFYSAVFVREFGQARPLVVGICSEGHGVTPQVLPLPACGLCLFGLNSEIVGVSADLRQIAYRVNLGFLFRTMIPLPEIDLILVLHETGAKAIRPDGAEAWSFSRDVLEDAHMDGSEIHFEFMDSEPVTLDVVSGKQLVQVR